MSIIAHNLFFSAVWNLGDVDHIASLCCSSKHSLEVINVIPCNTDCTLGISGEEVSKAVSHSPCKWRELLRNLSHPLPSHSSPSLGQKLKTKKWSDRKDLKKLFFFFFWKIKNQVWKVTYLIHPMFPDQIPSYLVFWYNQETLQISSNGNSVPALASPFQSFTFFTVRRFQCLIYIFPCGLQAHDFLLVRLLTQKAQDPFPPCSSLLYS